jgi:hypothetical protein
MDLLAENTFCRVADQSISMLMSTARAE